MYGIAAYTCLMYVKKIHQFLSSIKKMHTKENWFLLSASRCISGDTLKSAYHLSLLVDIIIK